MPAFSLANPQRHSIPRVPFRAIKQKVLGAPYELSVVFVDSRNIKRLNTKYRGIDSPTDVLSFAFSKKTGELYFSLHEVRRKARMRGMKTDDYLPFLFIHGLLHLKGLDHGRTMDKLERAYCRAFSIPFFG